MATPVVMIVEDERDLGDLYSAWLADTYDGIAASTATEAIEHLDDSIDILLLDRRMPDRSGDTVLDAIQERDLDCRVAMVTAVKPDFDTIDMGIDNYIEKPVSADNIRTLVSQLLDRPSYEEEIQEFFAVASKKKVLESEKPPSELQCNSEYAALQDRFRRIRSRVDGLVFRRGIP